MLEESVEGKAVRSREKERKEKEKNVFFFVCSQWLDMRTSAHYGLPLVSESTISTLKTVLISVF